MTTTIPVRTATNGQSNIAVVTLPDGSTAVAHVAIDGTGAVVVPATSADFQTMSAAIAAQTAQLEGQALILTDAFGASAIDPLIGPVSTNQTEVAGVALGAPTAYGTAPTGIVPGVNAFVTGSALPAGAATAANQNATPAGTSATSAQGVQGVTGGVPLSVAQSGTWSVSATQSGTWTIALGAGSAAIGSVTVANFPATQAVSGIVTANLGTLNGVALDTSVQAVKATLGSPFQAGGLIGNTAFALNAGTANIGSIANITGTVSLPTGAATAALQSVVQSAPGTSAGTALTVQGSASGVPLPVSGTVKAAPTTGATMTTSQPTVGTTATLLNLAGTVHNEIQNPPTNSQPIYIGETNAVTTATGWAIWPGSSQDLSRYTGPLYAVCSAPQAVGLFSY